MKGSMEKKPYHYRTCMYQINGEVSWPICFYAFFQDDKFKVNNLISNGGFKKWLTSAADKSGQAEVTLQLKKAVYLSYIDLGKFVLAASDQTLFHSLASHFTINPFYFNHTARGPTINTLASRYDTYTCIMIQTIRYVLWYS